MGKGNPGCPLDLSWLDAVHVSAYGVKERAKDLQKISLRDDLLAGWQVRAVTVIDLTTLAGDDTSTNVTRLCSKAATPLAPDMSRELGFNKAPIEDGDIERITTAAVCVYPLQVACAANYLRKAGLADKIAVASVAAGFPSGQYPLETRLQEIRYAVEYGAAEIDIVIDRGFVLAHEWEKLYNTIRQMKEACGPAHLKTIISAGELGSFENIYKTSIVAMMAGSDFIKTSTGKEAINATLPIGVTMCRAIAEYYHRTNIKVGFKPAGGIRTSKDAISWLILMKEELGHDWLYPDLFRIGASGLLVDIEQELYHHITGRFADINEFTMA